MNVWQVIRDACDRPLSVETASRRLEEQLRTMSADDVAAFCQRFDELMDEAYRWDLWGVAYLINGGCSDDAFMDFRSSLIALGEQTFDAAMADPESLLSLSEQEREALFDEGMLYCGPSVYEALTGKPPRRSAEFKSAPEGQPWEETAEDLGARFPRAWAVYGWEQPEQPKPAAPAAKPWWKFW